jgi:hypothetical protein
MHKSLNETPRGPAVLDYFVNQQFYITKKARKYLQVLVAFHVIPSIDAM